MFPTGIGGQRTRAFKVKFPSSEKAELDEQQVEVASPQAGRDGALASTDGGGMENTVNILIDFQIKEVKHCEAFG